MKDYTAQINRIRSGAPPEIWDEPSEYWKGGGKPAYMQSDFETYGGLDIGKVGHYRYIRDKTFEPLLLAVAFDDEETFIIDLASGEDVPDIVWAAVFDDGITKTAWHASFERTVFGVMAGMVLPPDSWKCTMIWAASLSLPLALKNAAAVLRTGEQKDRAGEALIKKFSVPRMPTATNPATRNFPKDDPVVRPYATLGSPEKSFLKMIRNGYFSKSEHRQKISDSVSDIILKMVFRKNL